MNLTVNTLSKIEKEERPYEKCEHLGAENLTDVELLAIVLRTGSKGEDALSLSRKILYHLGEDGLIGLYNFSMERLLSIRGIGKVKAIQLLSLCELSRRMSKAKAQIDLNFTCPESVARYYMEDLRHKRQEVMKLIMLNTKSQLICEKDISKGTVNASLITPREIFIEALQRNAVSVILIHNHPSGDPSPSSEDILVTERIWNAGEMIGISVVDHLIIGNNCYVSFVEKGLLPMKG